jgi:transposase
LLSCASGERSIGQVSKDFDLTETAVREWLKQAERDTGTRRDGGLTSEERRELAERRPSESPRPPSARR